MLYISALLLWVFIGIVLFIILRNTSAMRPIYHWQRMLLLLLSALLLLLYARPHDDITAGQDGPAYLHCASEYAKHGQLTYQDEMLAKVTPEIRSQFLYQGHKSSYLTKFGSLHLPNIKNDNLQTWFQVGPSLLLSIVAKFFKNRAILYIMPLFGIFNGIVIAFLAMSVLGKSRTIGWSAAILYWLNPLVIWHARALRPEFVASFLLWSGFAILLKAIKEQKSIFLWLLAGLSINLAPFFHITATMVVLPASAVVAWCVAKGNKTGLIFGATQSIMVSIFALQSTQFADPYSLSRYLQVGPDGLEWLIWLIAGITGWCLVGTISLFCAKHLPSPGSILTSSKILRIIASLAITTLFVAILLHIHYTPASELKSLVYHYYYRTDLRSVTRLISIPIALCGFFGLLSMLLKGGSRTAARYTFCLIIIPAALGIGNMYDFFTTRYLIVSMIPLLTISLVSLVQWIASKKPSIPYLGAIITAVLIALLLHGRLLLIKHVERNGLYKYLDQVANVIKPDNTLLLCEYSQVAGAFEHLFGIPTLGLDGENVSPYSRAEKAWRKLMKETPQRCAYYLTPFNSHPRSKHMNFEFVKKFRLDSSILVDRRWDLPVATKPWKLTLYLYKITLDELVPTDALISMSPSNMGFLRFSGCRQKNGVSISGINIPQAAPLSLKPCTAKNMSNAELWLLLHENSQNFISIGQNRLSTQPQSLGNNWFILRIPASDLSNNPEVWTEGQALLSQAFYIKSETIIDANTLFRQYIQKSQNIESYVARWARQSATITLPSSSKSGAVMLMFMTPPSEIGEPAVITSSVAGKTVKNELPAGNWRWSAYPIPATSNSTDIKFHTSHPFNPHINGFDDDLSLFMGYGNLIQL